MGILLELFTHRVELPNGSHLDCGPDDDEPQDLPEDDEESVEQK